MNAELDSRVQAAARDMGRVRRALAGAALACLLIAAGLLLAGRKAGAVTLAVVAAYAWSVRPTIPPDIAARAAALERER